MSPQPTESTFAEADLLAGVKRSAGYLADRYAPHIGRILERGNQHLRSTLHHCRGGHFFEDDIQQRGDVGGGLAPVERHPALLRRAVDSLEVQLFLSGVQIEHEVENLLLNLVRAAVGLVDLVDHHDGFLSHLEGLLEHETRLGHAALESVHEQQHAVRHIEHALNLASEVAVAGSVDDVDLDILVGDGHVLG